MFIALLRCSQEVKSSCHAEASPPRNPTERFTFPICLSSSYQKTSHTVFSAILSVRDHIRSLPGNAELMTLAGRYVPLGGLVDRLDGSRGWTSDG